MRPPRIICSFFCLFFISLLSISYAQKVTKPRQGQKRFVDSLPHNDTLSVKAMDSIHIVAGASNKTTILLLKETPSNDNMKYVWPVLTLLLGIFINRLIDYFSERKRFNRTGRRWKAELALLESPIQKQITALDDFNKELNKDIYSIPNLSIYFALKGEIFSILDKSELLRYIQQKNCCNYTEAVKKANEVVATTNILTDHYDSIKNKFNEFLTETSKYNSEATRHLQHLLKSFSRYGTLIEKQYGGNPMSEKEYKSLYDLFAAHIYPKQETGDFDLYELKDKFFIPLIKELGHLRHDDRTKDMQDAATACLNTISLIKAEKGYMIKNAEIIKRRYEETLKELPAVLKKMS